MIDPAKAKSVTTFEATVIRKDGTVIPLGVVSSTSKWWRFHPKRLAAWYRIKKANLGVR